MQIRARNERNRLPLTAGQIFLLVMSVLCLTACATHDIEENFIQLREDGAIIVPVSFTDDGGMLVDIRINGQGPYPFLVDTGSTTSAIFNDARARLGLDVIPGRQVRVRGIAGTDLRPVASAASMDLGTIREQDKLLVILEARRQNAGNTAWGLIGLDILHDFALAWYPAEQSFYFIPQKSLVPYLQTDWVEVPLYRDPFNTGLEELYFADISIDNRTINGLIDLGSSYTLINWEDVQNPYLIDYRRTREREWRLQGAIDEFRPMVESTFPVMQIGDYPFFEQPVLVYDFNSQNITGMAGQPLFIAGASMLSKHDFIMDFANRKLYLSRASMDRPRRGPKGTRLRSFASGSVEFKP